MRDQVYNKNSSQWCHTSHGRSGWCTKWTWMNDSQHSALPNYVSALVSAQTWWTWSKFWKLPMVGHGNRGEWDAYRKVRMSGYIYRKPGDGSVCPQSVADCADTRWAYHIHRADIVYSRGSCTDRRWSSWMEIIIHRNNVLAVNHDCMYYAYNCWASNAWYYHCKESINDVRSYSFGNHRAV